MKAGQIVYKINNLNQTVERMRREGYAAEYGKAKNPYNALIYFSEGPYLELMAQTGVPKMIKSLMGILGYAKLANRFKQWDSAAEGNISIALEISATEMADIYQYLKEVKKIKVYKVSTKRVDVHGRKLSCVCLFTEYVNMPFFVTEFSDNPKPQNYIHPNGGKRISNIEVQMESKEYTLFMSIIERFNLKEDLDIKITRGNFKIQYNVEGVKIANQ